MIALSRETRCARAGTLNEKLEDSGITGFHAFNAVISTVQIRFEVARIVHCRSLLDGTRNHSAAVLLKKRIYILLSWYVKLRYHSQRRERFALVEWLVA